MNAVLSLSHFCEIHGPSVLFSTQAFHFAGEVHSGVLEPSGLQFFGCLKKLRDYNEGSTPSVNNVACEACESISGYITNDYQNKISFLSTRLPIDSNVSSLLKQAAVRSLSCEVVPGKEGQVYFGDTVRGHVLSSTFFLKDAQARGFHRWYSILVFMKDKHFLLNSWHFFQRHINQIFVYLQKQAAEVYANEQRECSQRGLRLSNLDRKHSSARSLIKLTASTDVFAQLHTWFTWLLSTGAKRLEEHLLARTLDTEVLENQVGEFVFNNEAQQKRAEPNEEHVDYLRQLRQTFGAYNFQRVLYSTLIGRQIVVRGPEVVVEKIINLLKLFLPLRKIRCQDFGGIYNTPEKCNIVGLDLSAAVPKSSENIMRLDIVPNQDIDTTALNNSNRFNKLHNFIIKNERKLPEKLPSLLLKIDKALSDESLTNRVVALHLHSLLGQWFHVADVIREARKKQNDLYMMCLRQSLGVQEQDDKLIEFWTT